MSTTSPSCWLLHQDRFFQPGQYMGQPAAEILSKAVAIAPNLGFSTSQHRRRHSYHPGGGSSSSSSNNNNNNNSSSSNQQNRVQDRVLDQDVVEKDQKEEEAAAAVVVAEAERDVVDGPRGQAHGGRGHGHRRGVSASLRGFFRHGPRYGGAAWIELE